MKIPAGIATGQRLRLTGEGEAGTLGGPTGDLYVVIFVREHEFFQRDGNDLHCTVPLAFTTLALGGEIKVPGIDGERDGQDSREHADRHRRSACAARACPTSRDAAAAICS